jgi:hypothetical protein
LGAIAVDHITADGLPKAVVCFCLTQFQLPDFCMFVDCVVLIVLAIELLYGIAVGQHKTDDDEQVMRVLKSLLFSLNKHVCCSKSNATVSASFVHIYHLIDSHAL